MACEYSHHWSLDSYSHFDMYWCNKHEQWCILWCIQFMSSKVFRGCIEEFTRCYKTHCVHLYSVHLQQIYSTQYWKFQTTATVIKRLICEKKRELHLQIWYIYISILVIGWSDNFILSLYSRYRLKLINFRFHFNT